MTQTRGLLGGGGWTYSHIYMFALHAVTLLPIVSVFMQCAVCRPSPLQTPVNTTWTCQEWAPLCQAHTILPKIIDFPNIIVSTVCRGGWWWWDAGGIVYVNLPLAASVGCTLLYSFHVNDPRKTPGKNSSPPVLVFTVCPTLGFETPHLHTLLLTLL